MKSKPENKQQRIVGFPFNAYAKGFRSPVGYWVPYESISWWFKELLRPWKEIAIFHEEVGHPLLTFADRRFIINILTYWFKNLNMLLEKEVKRWQPIVEGHALSEISIDGGRELYNLAWLASGWEARYYANKLLTIRKILLELLERLNINDPIDRAANLNTTVGTIEIALIGQFMGELISENTLTNLEDALLKLLGKPNISLEEFKILFSVKYFNSTSKGDRLATFTEIDDIVTLLSMLYHIQVQNQNISLPTLISNIIFYIYGVNRAFEINSKGFIFELPLFRKYYPANKFSGYPENFLVYPESKQIPPDLSKETNTLMYSIKRTCMWELSQKTKQTLNEYSYNVKLIDIKMMKLAFNLLLNKLHDIVVEWQRYKKNKNLILKTGEHQYKYNAKWESNKEAIYTTYFLHIEECPRLVKGDEVYVKLLAEKANNAIYLLDNFDSDKLKEIMQKQLPDVFDIEKTGEIIKESARSSLFQLSTILDEAKKDGIEPESMLELFFEKPFVRDYQTLTQIDNLIDEIFH